MNSVLNEIEAGADGLLYTSETDSPVEPFLWPQAQVGDGPLTAARLLELTGQPADTRVERLDFARFFEPLGRIEEWYGAEERAAALRYAVLRELLQARLTGLAVFAVGDTRRHLYVVGRTPAGDLAGLHTVAVET